MLHLVSDEGVPELETRRAFAGEQVASVDAIAVLIQSFATMIGKMEDRITGRITENAEASKERWQRWEAEFKAYQATNDHRVALVEGQIRDYLAREHDDDVRNDARVRPVKTLAGWVWGNWRDIVLLAIALIALVTVALESIGAAVHIS